MMWGFGFLYQVFAVRALGMLAPNGDDGEEDAMKII